jgi:hypothetical protein
MARGDPNFRLRIPEELLGRFRARAEASNRSLTQEIVATLERALDQEGEFAEMKKQMKLMEAQLAVFEKNIAHLTVTMMQLTQQAGIEYFPPINEKD